jgi:hypothetical protein
MLAQTLRLPDRPIKVDPKSISRSSGLLLSAAIIGALLAFFAAWQIPSLLRDTQIRSAPVIVPDGDVQDGECTQRKAIFVDCSAHVSYNYEGQHYESDVSLFFIDFHSGDYSVDLVISGEKPELATISIGLDKFWNRVILLAVVVLGLGALFVGGIVAAIRNAQARRKLAVPGRLSLIQVEVEAMGNVRSRSQYNFKEPNSETANLSVFDKGTAPLLAWDGAGGQHGYAIRHENVKVPVLLDRGLNRIDLTATERSEMLAAIAAAEGAAKPPQAPVMPGEGQSALGILLTGLRRAVWLTALIVTGVLGYWLYYALAATNAFDEIGMEINNMLPAPMNEWACDKLQLRFGDQRAPYGCTAADFVSWK